MIKSARFTCPDPLWEKYYSWTPYQYAICNPILRLDGNGMFEEKNATTQKADAFINSFDLDVTIGLQFGFTFGVYPLVSLKTDVNIGSISIIDGDISRGAEVTAEVGTFPLVSAEIEKTTSSPQKYIEFDKKNSAIDQGSSFWESYKANAKIMNFTILEKEYNNNTKTNLAGTTTQQKVSQSKVESKFTYGFSNIIGFKFSASTSALLNLISTSNTKGKE